MATLNLSDVPEMMPGARPRATPAERQEFELRCRQLHNEELEERRASQPVASAAFADFDFVAMFPALDADLVRTLCGDASTLQQAMETLLALNAATEDVAAIPEAPGLPREVGIEDMGQFPSLTDKDGWQFPSKRGFELDKEADLGSVWCSRAKEASELADVGWGPRKQALATSARRKASQAVLSGAVCAGGVGVEEAGEYELRQARGQRRAKKKFSVRVGGLSSEKDAVAADVGTLAFGEDEEVEVN